MTDDVIVVGAGILGLLTARALLQGGRKVMLLDAGAARPCASWAAGGILSPLFPWRYEEAVSRLTHDAVSRYQRLADELRAMGCTDPEVDRCGMLVLPDSSTDKKQQAVQWSMQYGVDLQLTTSRNHLSSASPDQPAWWLPQLGAVRNSRLLRSLRESLAQQGVVAQVAHVSRLERVAGGWQLVLPQERRVAKQVVVATGAWSAELLSPLGVALPVSPVKGQMALYRLPAWRQPSVVLSPKGYLVPRRDGLVLVGSTLEPQVDNTLPDAKGAAALADKWQALLQLLGDAGKGAQQLAQWAGLRPGNVTDVPFIGEVPGQAGLFVCTGHYRNGICAAPASVELLVAQVCGEPLPFDQTPYSLPSSSSSSVSD